MFNRSSLIAATTVATTLFLGACSSKDTGVNVPDNNCTSTAVAKGYDLLPIHPSIAHRYRDNNRDTETNTEFGCAEAVFNGDERNVIYPTRREVTVSLTSFNKVSFKVEELISSTQDERGGSIKLHGYRVSNLPLRLLVPNSEKAIDAVITFSKPVTLYNSISFGLNQLKTLDFGEARISFPNLDQAGITNLMIDLAPLLVKPAELTEVEIQVLKDVGPLATAFLSVINFDTDGFLIQMEGSSSWIDTDLNIPLGNRIGSGEEIETKLRMTIGADVPSEVRLLIPDKIEKIKLVIDINIVQVLVPKVGPVKRDISIKFDGIDQIMQVNEVLKLITKGDTDGDYAVDIMDQVPDDVTLQ